MVLLFFRIKNWPGLVMIILLTCVNSGLAQERLRFVGENKVPPYSFKENGRVKGIDVDIIAEAAKRMKIGIDIELVPWKRMQVYVKKGLCDAGFTMFYMKEREQFGIFPTVPVHYSTFAVFVLKGSEFRFKTIEDLYGKRVGSIIGYRINELFDKASYEGRIIVNEVPRHSQNVKKLFSGRIDCLVSNYDSMVIAIKNNGLSGKIVALPAPLQKSKGAYIVFSKAGKTIRNKDAFANKFGMVLKEMKNDGSIQKIQENYLVPSLNMPPAASF